MNQPLVEAGENCYQHEDWVKRIGHSFGFDYPPERVRIILGPGRADWDLCPHGFSDGDENGLEKTLDNLLDALPEGR